MPKRKKCVGLFAGIGGIEIGLEVALDAETSLLCEIDPAAQQVLRKQFPKAKIVSDVTSMAELPDCDILTAGFPCQDISQAGPKKGIEGARSGLVSNVFRLLERKSKSKRPEWIVIENVSNIISLHAGAAMAYLTENLEALGYQWGYRVVDARAFGVPQRRLRMILVASKSGDVRSVLFSQNVKDPPVNDALGVIDENASYGFYWTEGFLGLGWAKESVPTIKGGSTIGIPSPPAIWIPARDEFGTPDIRDAERMQGFPPDWTFISDEAMRKNRNARWKQVGNAVCTKMSQWVGKQIAKDVHLSEEAYTETPYTKGKWPKACWGCKGRKFAVPLSTWPVKWAQHPLSEFCRYPMKPMSLRGASGFYDRASRSTLIRYPERFLQSLRIYIENRRRIENG